MTAIRGEAVALEFRSTCGAALDILVLDRRKGEAFAAGMRPFLRVVDASRPEPSFPNAGREALMVR